MVRSFLKFQAALRAVAVLACVGLSSESNADQLWDAVQITCSKDLNYFSLRTMALEDVGPNTEAAGKDIERESGIFDIGRLLAHPYTCDLPDYTIEQGRKFPARTITVQISDYIEPHDKGFCGGVQSFHILIRLNGKEIGKYWVNNCSNHKTYLVELDTFSQLHYCQLPEGHTEDEICRESRLQP